jgi:hypothetical protein
MKTQINQLVKGDVIGPKSVKGATKKVVKTFKTGAYILEGNSGWKYLIVESAVVKDGLAIQKSREIKNLVSFHNKHIRKV